MSRTRFFAPAATVTAPAVAAGAASDAYATWWTIPIRKAESAARCIAHPEMVTVDLVAVIVIVLMLADLARMHYSD